MREKQLRVLFLDLDGVLNSYQSTLYWKELRGTPQGKTSRWDEFCPICMSNFSQVLKRCPGLKVVFSTSHRQSRLVPGDFVPMDELIRWLTDNGLEVPDEKVFIGMTPLRTGSRTSDIFSWVKKNKPDDFVVLDDEMLGDGTFNHLDGKFVHCPSGTGFGYYQLIDVLKWFLGEVPDDILAPI